jgi:hypothetical protein
VQSAERENTRVLSLESHASGRSAIIAVLQGQEFSGAAGGRALDTMDNGLPRHPQIFAAARPTAHMPSLQQRHAFGSGGRSLGPSTPARPWNTQAPPSIALDAVRTAAAGAAVDISDRASPRAASKAPAPAPSVAAPAKAEPAAPAPARDRSDYRDAFKPTKGAAAAAKKEKDDYDGRGAHGRACARALTRQTLH